MRIHLALLAPKLVLKAPSAHLSRRPLNPELLALALQVAVLRHFLLEQLEEQRVLGEVPVSPAGAPLPGLLMKAAFLRKLHVSMGLT